MKAIDNLIEEHVVLALRSALGNIAIAAADLGVSRAQLQDYIVNRPALREEKAQIKEALIDEAEDQLIARMKNSDPLLIFFLRTQARARGYEPNLLIGGTDGKSLSVNLDARSLIAAMRQGIEDAESEKEDLPDIRSD